MSKTRQERIKAMRISAILGPSAEQLEDMKAELKALWARVELLDAVVEAERAYIVGQGSVREEMDAYDRLTDALAALDAHDSEQG